MNRFQNCIGGVFGHRQQSQMTFRHFQAIGAANHAEHFHADPLHRFHHHRLMRVGTDLIQDHSGQRERWIILLESEHYRRHAFAGRTGIHDQYHRRRKRAGQRGRAGNAAAATVEQSHHAFHHGNVHAARSRGKHRQQSFLRHQPAVQIVAGTTGGQRVIAGINIIRPDLVGLSIQAAPTQRRKQPADNRRFPYAALRPGDYQPGNPYPVSQYSTPHLPKIPCEIGCFTISHSVASSASASRACGILRPVSTSLTLGNAVCSQSMNRP